VLQEQGDLARPDAAHHEDRVLESEAAQRDPLLDEGHPKTVRLRGEAPGHRLEAVSVGVRLQDHHDPGRGDVGPDRGQVVAQPRLAHDRVRRAKPRVLGVERRLGGHTEQ
jgi:hypothetical protein